MRLARYEMLATINARGRIVPVFCASPPPVEHTVQVESSDGERFVVTLTGPEEAHAAALALPGTVAL